MKKIATLVLLIVMNVVVYHQSYAMHAAIDIPDEMVFIEDFLNQTSQECARFFNSFKNSIIGFMPSKKVAVAASGVAIVAIFLALASNGEVSAESDGVDVNEIIQKNDCLLVAMQNWCSTFLNLCSTECPEDVARIGAIADQASSFFYGCVNKSPWFVDMFPKFNYSLPWNEAVTCASFMGHRILQECTEHAPIKEQCTWLAFKVVEALHDPQVKEHCLRLLGQQ